MKKILLILTIISSTLMAEIIDFESAVNIALENNLSIKMSENGLQMTRNLVNPGVLLPNVTMSGSSNYTKTDPATGTTNERHINSASLSSSYTLFSGFAVLNGYKKLKLQYNQSELETRYQVESIISALAQSFYSVANAEEQLELALENLNISRERLQRVKEKDKVGRVNKVEVLTAEVDYNRDSISVQTAQLSFENSCRSFNVLLNRDPESKVEVSRDVTMLELPLFDELKQNAMEKNADFLATKYGIDLAEMDLKIAKAGYMPTVSLSGSYGNTQTNFDFDPALSDPDNFWSVGMSLNFSLFNGFQRKIKTQNARLSLDNQKLAVEQSKLNLEKNVASQYRTYVNSQKTLEMERLNLEATQANFDRTKELFELGQITAVQFREAQLNLMKAKSNISAGQYSVKLNEIGLLQLAGMLLD